MKILAVLWLALASWCAGAAVQCPAFPPVTPYTHFDRTQVTAPLAGSSPAGQWSTFWYRQTDATGAVGWCNSNWICLTRYCPSTTDAWLTARSLLAAASDLAAGLASLSARFGVTPAAGTQDEFEFLTLQYAACQAAAASPPPGASATCSMAAPQPPAVAPAFVAKGGSVFRANNGAIVGTAGKTVAAGTPLDCTLAKLVNSTGGVATTYCAVAGGPSNEVAQVKP